MGSRVGGYGVFARASLSAMIEAKFSSISLFTSRTFFFSFCFPLFTLSTFSGLSQAHSGVALVDIAHVGPNHPSSSISNPQDRHTDTHTYTYMRTAHFITSRTYIHIHQSSQQQKLKLPPPGPQGHETKAHKKKLPPSRLSFSLSWPPCSSPTNRPSGTDR